MDVLRNAFSAFGGAADEATINTLRTDLALALRKFIENSQMGQAKVGEILGLKQNVVSQIVRGKTEHLSVERLIRAMVNAKIAGYAEWGASAEDARAGVGGRTSPLRNMSVSFADSIGNPYPDDWTGGDQAARFAPWTVVSDRKLSRRRSE